MSEDWVRADKWLWYARFFKTRSLASKVCNAGQLRIDGTLVSKAHSKLKVGDVLTFPQARHIRVVKVLALATRRGPAAEARELYQDLKPPAPGNRLPPSGPGARSRGAGRPTKKERRALERLVEQGK
jgi:ribosome-associated heat shock protein Hsp15